jgi:hypothetical protein
MADAGAVGGLVIQLHWTTVNASCRGFYKLDYL